jgi:hypothetical protein
MDYFNAFRQQASSNVSGQFMGTSLLSGTPNPGIGQYGVRSFTQSGGKRKANSAKPLTFNLVFILGNDTNLFSSIPAANVRSGRIALSYELSEREIYSTMSQEFSFLDGYNSFPC